MLPTSKGSGCRPLSSAQTSLVPFRTLVRAMLRRPGDYEPMGCLCIYVLVCLSVCVFLCVSVCACVSPCVCVSVSVVEGGVYVCVTVCLRMYLCVSACVHVQNWEHHLG